MLSPQASLYAEVRRLLKNQFTRITILVLLILALIYHFGEGNHRTTTPAWVPSPTSSHEEIGDTLALRSQVGKVHAVFGEPNPVYERALVLHKAHSDAMGHPMFVLRERLLSGLWSKPGFILSVMLQELAKPEENRLKWLLYASLDCFRCERAMLIHSHHAGGSTQTSSL